MSLASECNNIIASDIIRHNLITYRGEISNEFVYFFFKHFQRQLVCFPVNKRKDRSASQNILESNLKNTHKILCLPDPNFPHQLMLTSPKKTQITLMLPNAFLSPQLFLPLPQDFSPKLYLPCSKDKEHLLLPMPNQLNQKKSAKKKVLLISYALIEKIFKYDYSPIIGYEKNINMIILKISLCNELFNNSYRFFDTIKNVIGNQDIFFFISNILPYPPINENQNNAIIKPDLKQPKKNFSELLTENFRLSFRVQPPAIGRKRWVLSLFLQSREDPSLLIPIGHLAENKYYNNKNQTISGTNYDIPSFIDRNYVHPFIEKDLKKLATIFKPFGQFERNSDKIKVYLSIDQTYTFLKEIVPKLREQSYGVLIPDWWGKQDSQLGIKLQLEKKEIRDVNLSLLGANAQLEYNWEVSVGKTGITLQEFSYLVSLKEPLVKWNDKWIEMESKEIEYLTEFIKSNKTGKKKRKRNRISLKRSLELTIGKNRLKEGVRVVNVKTGKGLEKIFDQFTQPKQISLITAPKTLNGILRPFQQTGLSWMAFMHQFQFGVCLADDMGLGKTIQVLAFLLHQQENHQKKIQDYKFQGKKRKISPLGPSLVVCPLSLVKNWVQETEKFAPSMKIYVHYGNTRVGGKTFLSHIAKSNMVITTYQQVKKDKSLLSKVLWENIILDEAQNIKNYYTLQTKAIKSLKSNFKIGLTGTPIENRLREIWSIMDFLNPGFLGTLHSFHEKYCAPIERKNDQNCLAELKQILNPFILRRLKSEKSVICDLPNKLERKIYVDLTLEQATLYQATVNKLERELEDAEGISRSGIILSTLLKLKQICNHPSQFLHEKNPWNLEDENTAQFYQSKFPSRSGKLKNMTCMLKKIIDKGEKAVIFTQFTQMGALLQSYISKTLQTEVLYLNGSTPSDTRDLMVHKFQQSNKNPAIFILSLKAGGVGLNLTAANHVFHYDRWWNPAVEDQASDRIYRIGQKREVTITKFVSTGTIEEKIDLMIEKKKKLSKDILNSAMSWISKISTEELKKLLILNNNSKSPLTIAI